MTCQVSRLATNWPRSLRLVRSLSRVTMRSPTPARFPSASSTVRVSSTAPAATSWSRVRPARRAACLVGVGQQERAHAAGPVGQGGFEGGVFHGCLVAAVDAAAQVVVGEHGGVAGAQAEAGRAFPAGGEAAHLASWAAPTWSTRRRNSPPAAGLSSCSWSPTSSSLAPCWCAQSAQLVDHLARGHARLVEDDQRSRRDGVLVAPPPCRSRVRGWRWVCSKRSLAVLTARMRGLVGQDAGGGFGHGQADHRPPARLCQARGQGAHGVGLSGAGRADQRLDASARGGHRRRTASAWSPPSCAAGEHRVDGAGIESGAVRSRAACEDGAARRPGPLVGAVAGGAVLVIDALAVAGRREPGRGVEDRAGPTGRSRRARRRARPGPRRPDGRCGPS